MSKNGCLFTVVILGTIIVFVSYVFYQEIYKPTIAGIPKFSWELRNKNANLLEENNKSFENLMLGKDSITAKEVQSISLEFNNLWDASITEVIQLCGGFIDSGNDEELKMDTCTEKLDQYLFKEGKAAIIHDILLSTFGKYKQLLKEQNMEYLRLPIYNEINRKVSKRSWEETHFASLNANHVLFFLFKIKNDNLRTEEKIYNKILERK